MPLHRLCGRGCHGYGIRFSAESAQETLASLTGEATCTACACDVSDSAAIETPVRGYRAAIRLDILVTTRALVRPPVISDKYQARLAQRIEQLQRGETPTVLGDQIVDMTDAGFSARCGREPGRAFHCSREAARLMIKNGTEGCIVNISSTSAFSGEGGCITLRRQGGHSGYPRTCCRFGAAPNSR